MTAARMSALTLALMSASAGVAQSPRPDQVAFRELFKELVETNTQYSNGSCTKAAEQIAVRMKAAGFTDAELTKFGIDDRPLEGGLVITMTGTSKSAKPMLLLAHIDVVEARREDWTRDPYTLIEGDGYFYARGVADDKAQAAIWADTLIRFRKEGFKPKRTIKVALTCGEESNGVAFNGAQYLAEKRPDLISAEFALNEGGGGRVNKDGTRQFLAMQVGEKATRTFTFETTNPGGHSSVPRPDNAIYDLAAAVTAVQKYKFAVQLNETTRAFFAQLAPTLPKPGQEAVAKLLANPQDPAAEAVLAMDPVTNSTLRTSCVATMLNAGHAPNALPQRARATINCRIFPGIDPESVRQTLISVVGNPKVSVTMEMPVRPIAIVPKLDPKIMEPAKKLAAEMFPGLPMLPVMATGATDATYTGMIGIPTYGIAGIFYDADGGGVHGLNERIRVKSVYDGRDYLYRLVKIYAMQ